MRRLLILCALSCAALFAQCPPGDTCTPNVNLIIPQLFQMNSPNWGILLNDNWSAVDLLLSGKMGVPGFRLGTTGPQPVCNANYRGNLFIFQGNGTSTGDTFQVCELLASGSYSWESTNGSNIAPVTTLLIGDGLGNAVSSGIVPANVFTLSGAQTVTGNKTFSGSNAYGTPSSITLTNGTGLPLTSGVTGVLPNANTNIGTSGATIPLNNGNNTVSGTNSVTGSIDIGTGGYIQSSAVPSPLDPPWNAKGDGATPTNCTTTLTGGAGGNGTVTCPSVAFTTTKGPIKLFQAGAANTGISLTIKPYQDLRATITSVSGSGVGNVATLSIPLMTNTTSIAWGTDDTSALNSFLGNGGNLYLPGLVFMHDGNLQLASNSTVSCLGTTLEATSYTSQYIGSASGVSNTTIQGCTIVGVQRGRADGLGASGIVFNQSSDTWSINNNISNFSQVGWSIQGANPATSVTSQRNHIVGGSLSYLMANGIFVVHGDQHSDATKVHCLWVGDACEENSSYGPAGDTVQVAYFTADGLIGDNVDAGCLADGSQHSTCINSKFTNVVSFCAQAIGDSFSTPYFASDANIENNTCINTDTGNNGIAAIGFEGLAGGKIQNNKIVNGSAAIAEIISGTASTGVLISGNHIFNPTGYGISIPGNASNLKIEGNYIDQNANTGYQPISMSNQTASVSNSTISNNTIVNACPGNAKGAIQLAYAVNVNGANNVISPGCVQAWLAPVLSSGSTLSQVSLLHSSLPVLTPVAPTVSATGGTGTSYTYSVQGYNNDGYSLPSTATTVSGPSVLVANPSSTAYNTISPGNAVTSLAYVSGATLGNGSCIMTVTNGGGSGATGSFNVSGGVAGTVTVTNAGTGYTSAPTAATLSGACSGSGAVITSTISIYTQATYYAVRRTACGSASAPCLLNPTGVIGFIYGSATSLQDAALTGDGTTAPTIPTAAGYQGTSFLFNDGTYTGWSNGGSAGHANLVLGNANILTCYTSQCYFANQPWTPLTEGTANWGALTNGWAHVYTEATTHSKIYSGTPGSGGNALATCAAGGLSDERWVSDATVNTPGTAYTSGGTYTIGVECTYNSSGSTYTWLVH